MNTRDYTFYDHRHVFSSWCAATAAGASPLCRLKIEKGKEIIESSELYQSLNFPDSQSCFDRWHDAICEAFISKANEIPVVGFSYGVAAKLLNCYLKTFYISSEKDSVFLHPPIDRTLLTALAQNNFADQKNAGENLHQKDGQNFRGMIIRLVSILSGNHFPTGYHCGT